MSTFNVLRWTALATGVVYGAYHTQVLKSAGAAKQEILDFKHQEKLIAEAKAEFAKLNAPKEVKTEKVTPGSINLDDPNIDFASVLLSAVDNL